MAKENPSRRAFIKTSAKAGVSLAAAPLVLPGCTVSAPRQIERYDVVVYGATSSGVTAAVQAARMGKSVVLIAPSGHIGGLSSSGLGATDIGKKAGIGGLSREFYRRVRRHYFDNPDAWKQETLAEYQSHVYEPGIDDEAMWYFEPHVAGSIFKEMLREAGVPIVMHERLDLRDRAGVKKEKARITTIVMESGRTFHARVFIDATYEGDLMAKAGVSYTIGRESNATYGETLNGIQLHRETYNFHMFARKVDPFVVTGDPTSGLIHGVHYPREPGLEGTGDDRVQAYCFRLCMTDVPENQIPFPKPGDYDPSRYELFLRYITAKEPLPWVPPDRARNIENPILGWDPRRVIMPNRKTDSNTKGPISFDYVGYNYDYPEAEHATRERIVEAHRSYQMGLIWFAANDPRVPADIQAPIREWGLPKDEFVENGHWPPLLYIREARRMVSDYVMTQHDCEGTRSADDPVGLGAYAMDSHIVSRYVTEDGWVRNEGHVGKGVKTPYGISYRSITPKAGECRNSLVSACVSASHVAFGSIRMEPVFMVLGQSAATAAALAIDDVVDVQDIRYEVLRDSLLEDGQVLEVLA